MKKFTENIGLKLLALVLAIVLYYALKTETAQTENSHERRFLFYR